MDSLRFGDDILKRFELMPMREGCERLMKLPCFNLELL